VSTRELERLLGGADWQLHEVATRMRDMFRYPPGRWASRPERALAAGLMEAQEYEGNHGRVGVTYVNTAHGHELLSIARALEELANRCTRLRSSVVEHSPHKG
jgi:hypothetical protein